jgi:signal transduction histidine kinase
VQVFRAFANSPRGELTMLFIASCAVVAVLFLTIISGSVPAASAASLRHVVLTLFVLGFAGVGAALLGLPQKLVSTLADPSAELLALREQVRTAQAVINAEAQVIVLWQRGERVRVVVHSLTGVAGLPTEPTTLERFGSWLDEPSAETLRLSLEQLFQTGTPFNMLVRTAAGAHLEADGRAAGANAVLRLRSTTGHRRDLATIIDRHHAMRREINACHALMDALPMPVWFCEADGRIRWSNAAYLKASGSETLAEVTGQPVELLETRQREQIRQSLSGHQMFRQQLPLVTGGRMHPHDVHVLQAERGSVGLAIDIGAIEDVREETDRRTAAYDRTLHRVATGVAIFGRDGRLAFFNDAYRGIWQLDADWLTSQKPSAEEILDRLRGLSRLPQVVSYRDWKAKVLASAKDGQDFEDWWHLLDGRTIHVTAERRADGVTFLFDDVTERLALESRYNALIDTQRETLDGLKEGVAVFAPDGRLQLSNRAFVHIWRLSRAMLGEGPHIDAICRQARVMHDDPELWNTIVRSITGIVDRRQTVSGRFVRLDQTVIDYTIVPLPDGATMLTFADVTDVRRAERALKERNEALEAADRLKSQFIRHVSYELRTPLQTIIGYTDLIQLPAIGALNVRQREFLGDIEASSKSLLSVINDILDLATIDAGGLELKVSPVEVRPIIDAALLGVKDRARVMNVTFDIDVQTDVRQFVADDKRIKQILYNLLSNAIGFSNAGDSVRVQAWRERGMIAFAVEDHGPGVPADQQARIFDRFESHSQGSGHRGAGLGLSIVKSLVELHGGTVSFHSEPGQGTRVTVRFPEAGIAPRRVEQREAAA